MRLRWGHCLTSPLCPSLSSVTHNYNNNSNFGQLWLPDPPLHSNHPPANQSIDHSLSKCASPNGPYMDRTEPYCQICLLSLSVLSKLYPDCPNPNQISLINFKSDLCQHLAMSHHGNRHMLQYRRDEGVDKKAVLLYWRFPRWDWKLQDIEYQQQSNIVHS